MIFLYEKLLFYINNIIDFLKIYVYNYFLNYLSILLLFLIITLKKGTNIIFINAITNDNIFSAIDFINDITKHHYYVNKYITPFLNDMRLKTNLGLIEKYIYYGLIQIISVVLNILFWNNYNIITYFALILTTHPFILEKIINIRPFSQIMEFFKKKINKLLKYSTLSIYSYCFNNICISILDRDPKISAQELKEIYKKKSYSHLIDFLKIFSISLVIQYMESIGSIYTGFVKMLYNYGALIEIKSEYHVDDSYINIKDDKEKILHIIQKRNWELFFNPTILKLIIKLYRENQNNNLFENLRKKLKYIEIIIGKFFAFYSISILFDSPYCSLILSFALSFVNNDNRIFYIPKLLSIIMWYFGYNLLHVTMMSELFELFDNKVIYFCINKVNDKIYENRYLPIHENKYNIDIVLNTIICLLIQNYLKSSIFRELLIILLSLTNKNPPIFLYIAIFGRFSNYNYMQLILIDVILYIGINIYHYRTTPKSKVMVNVINSYVSNIKSDIIKNKDLVDSVVVTHYMNKNNSNIENYIDNNTTNSFLNSAIIIDKNNCLENSFLNSGIIIPKNSTIGESFESYKRNKRKN